MQTFTYIRS